MDFFAQNISFLKHQSPEIARQVEQLAVDDIAFFVPGTAKNGQPTLNARDESGEELQIHSKYNPGDEGKRLAAAEDIDNKELVVVIGLGLGYHLLELVKRKKSYTQVLVIEKEIALFKLFIEHVQLEKLMKENVIFLVGQTPQEVTSAMSHFFWQVSTLKYAILQFMPLTTAINVNGSKDYYRELFSEIKRQLNYYILNQNTMMWRSHEMQEHIWGNMLETLTHHGINELEGAAKDIPAIVIAAGPSLDKQIEWVRRSKEKAVVICVDTALKTLLKAGIKPHIAVAVDYSQLNYEKIRDVDPEGYYMAVLPTVVPGFFEMFGDKTLMYYTSTPFFSWISRTVVEKGMVKSGGSVSHSAYEIAETMGCNPIIFTGLDLAYTGGVTHSSGGMYDGKTVDEDALKNYVPVDSVDGGKVHTTRAMWGMILAFEQMFAASSAEIIDATEGGALVRGTELQTFEDVYKRYLKADQPVEEILSSCLDKPVASNREKVLPAITEMVDDLTSIEEWAGEGCTNAGRVVKQMKKKGYDKQKVARYMGAVKEAHAKIIEKQGLSEPINNILTRLTRQYAMGKVLFEEGSEVRRKDIAKDMRDLKVFFEGIGEAGKWYREQVTAALEKLERALPQN